MQSTPIDDTTRPVPSDDQPIQAQPWLVDDDEDEVNGESQWRIDELKRTTFDYLLIDDTTIDIEWLKEEKRRCHSNSYRRST